MRPRHRHLLLILSLVFLVLIPPSVSAHIPPATVTGKVVDENGQPVAGVSVLEKGTNNGTSTDNAGNFQITVADANATLVFSIIGYTSQEVPLASKTTLAITLRRDASQLGEVVVTALGIERSSKSLGYSTAKVSADQVTINRTPNLMNALTGKIAGVSITSLGTGPAGTSKIRIRGQTSIAGQNNPLIVINGVPVDNTNFGSNPNNAGSDNSNATRGGGGITSDGGDLFSSINPDDIENMTVLKGAAASALYGSRGNNGVIMITTKSRGTKGLGITYNLNYSNETPLDFTDYQDQYGQGEGGIRPTTLNPTSGQWSFGEKIQPGMTHALYNDLNVPYVIQPSRIDEFYRNANNITNTLTMGLGGEKGGMHLSLSNFKSTGIVPNNSFDRKTVNVGFSYDVTPKLIAAGNVNYSYTVNNNPPNVGNQDNTIPTALMAMSNTMPLSVLKANAFDSLDNEYVYSRFRNRTNPYFTMARQFQNIKQDRIFGNVSLKYNLLKWLYVQGRVGQDFYSRLEEYNNFPTGQASLAPAPAGFVNGLYTQESRRFRELNTDVLLGVNQKFNDFGLVAFAGANHLYRRNELNSVQVRDFIVRDLYTVQNGRAKDPIYDLSEKSVNSVYGSAEISFRQTLYVTGTLRNDWFSTLSEENRSILYPSISASYIFSNSLKNLNWLDFGKFRVAYSEVGSDSDVPPYANQLFYGVNANLLNNRPIGGSNGSTVPNANLRPMRTKEVELGIEARMFDYRVGLELSVYRKLTIDQIVSAQISDASGFINTLINSGENVNRGIEMTLNLVPIRTKNFQWDFTFAGSYNESEVLSLLTDKPGERITVGTHIFNGELRQIVGLPLGQIAGFGYRFNDKGQQLFGSNGLPLRSNDLINFGSAIPKWVGGFTNGFNYKGISFSFLIDFKLGNIMLSGTNFNAIRHGLHKMTLEGREGGVLGNGVDINGAPNTVKAPVQSYWEVVRSQALVEPVIYDAGYWKLRQITMGYDFSKYLPEKWPVKGVKLSLFANNVLMIKKWVDNIDPESFGYTSDNLLGMESPGLPTTRALGLNLNVKF